MSISPRTKIIALTAASLALLGSAVQANAEGGALSNSELLKAQVPQNSSSSPDPAIQKSQNDPYLPEDERNPKESSHTPSPDA